MRRWAVAALIPALAGNVGCGGGTPEVPLRLGEDRLVEGRVTEVDATPMFVDGDGEMILRSARHGTVLIRVPARERVCAARGLDVFSTVDAGDSVRAVGRVTGPGEVTVCADESHVLERIAGPGGA